jgi:hypothetical protein
MHPGISIVIYGIILATLVMLVRLEFVQLRKGPTLEKVRRQVEKQRQMIRAAQTVEEGRHREAQSR